LKRLANRTGCCPNENHFSLALKHFLINLRLVPGDPKTRPSASNSWNRFSSTSPRFMSKKRFNERSKRFSFGQQPVEYVMMNTIPSHLRLTDKFPAYLCVGYVPLVLYVDHIGKFSLPANQYRFIFWFVVPLAFYLWTIYSEENRSEILHWLDIRALSRQEWYFASALMVSLVLVIAAIPLIPSLADYYKPGRISVGRKLIWLAAWFPGWELMHRCLLAYHIPRSVHRHAWLLIPIFEGVYHFNKPWPEMLGMFVWSGVLTYWTIKRKNACLAILAHLVLECLLIAYLGFAS
jgi:hypothetical protein